MWRVIHRKKVIDTINQISLICIVLSAVIVNHVQFSLILHHFLRFSLYTNVCV